MLGIIGGMGPMASSLFYEIIYKKTGAEKDQDNLNLILYSDSGMPDRTGAILSKDPVKINEVAERILKDANILKAAGCTYLAVTCNTAHFFVNMVEDKIDIPFVHMIRETGKKLGTLYSGEKVAVLATDGTIKTRLYQDELEKYGVIPVAPPEDIQKMVMAEIYDYVKAGKDADPDIWKNIEEWVEAEGCKAAVLGCTELPIVKKQLGLSDLYIDPMEVMADKCLEIARKAGEIK